MYEDESGERYLQLFAQAKPTTRWSVLVIGVIMIYTLMRVLRRTR